MTRFGKYIGIDLGGARGKTTAVATLSPGNDGAVVVEDIAWRRGLGSRSMAGAPWTDDQLVDLLAAEDDPSSVLIAVDAPLVAPACVRCTATSCPGAVACEVPAVVWLRTRGAELSLAAEANSDRIVAIPQSSPSMSQSSSLVGASDGPGDFHSVPLQPYVHRCTEVVRHYQDDVLTRDQLGNGNGPLSARAGHLRRVLEGLGYRLNENLIEVSPRATVRALWDEDRARGYKRDADPWLTRASIVEDLRESLIFGTRSRLSREEVLRNDHCFEALLCAYTAFLYDRDRWEMPEDPVFAEDGWVWVPPER